MNVGQLHDLKAIKCGWQIGGRHLHAVHLVAIRSPDHAVNEAQRGNDGKADGGDDLQFVLASGWRGAPVDRSELGA